MKKLFACLLALVLACTFLVCSNNASGTLRAQEHWSVLTLAKKSSLVGKWEGTDKIEGLQLALSSRLCGIRPKTETVNGLEFTLSISVNSNYEGKVIISAKVVGLNGSSMQDTFYHIYGMNTYVIQELVDIGNNIDSNDIETMINAGLIEIDASGTKIRMQHPLSHDPNKKIVLTKQ